MDVFSNIFLVENLGRLRKEDRVGHFYRFLFSIHEGMLINEQSLLYILLNEIHASRKNRIQLNWLLCASLTS